MTYWEQEAMRTGLIVVLVAVLVIIGAFAFGLVDINQTRTTKLPEIAVKGGQAPAFDVKTADVNVGTRTTNVEVPDVEVRTKKEEIKVPTVDVKKAD